jgi:ferritin-like metal-binding protein YciE
MTDKDIHDKLVSYIRDAHAMEKNVEQMLNAMIVTTQDDVLRSRLESHKGETEHHAQRLAQRLEALGENTSTSKDMGAIVGSLAGGLQEIVRADKAAKNARDGFVTENLEIAAYELLERLAVRDGDHETAQVARRNKREEEAMREFFSSNWDRAIDLTLAEEDVRAGSYRFRGAIQPSLGHRSIDHSCGRIENWLSRTESCRLHGKTVASL